MRIKQSILICFGIALVLMTASTAAAATYTVNDSTGPIADFTSIQTAIDNAAVTDGDTILVYPGTYNENVNVKKQLNITSTGGAAVTNVIAVTSGDHVFDVTADWVTISGFSVSGATDAGMAGIYLNGSNNSMVINNTLSNNAHGILLIGSNYNNLTNNTAPGNDAGIEMGDSDNNTLTNNTLSGNVYAGIYMFESSNNTLTGNEATYNVGNGIWLSYADYNDLTDNTASFSTGQFTNGIFMQHSNHNTLTNNTASNNPNDGIDVDVSSNNNTLINNTAEYNWRGIILTTSSYNDLIGNTASNNVGDDGIYLDRSNYNTLTGNTVEYNGDEGIEMDSSSYNTLTNNTFSYSSSDGIDMEDSSNNNILINNTVEYNDHGGIELSDSDYNMLTNNTVSNNFADDAIHLDYSDHNTLTNNTVSNNVEDGIDLEYSINNSVVGNTMSSNTGSGIDLDDSDYNTLTSNMVLSNANVGIEMDYSDYNLIYNNYFDNTDNTEFTNINSGNIWNITKTAGTNIVGGSYLGGNYWSDYGGVDNDWDGIGDSQFDLDGANIDYLPLMGTFFIVETPENNANYATSTIPLNVSSNAAVDTWWYSINGTANVTFIPYVTLLTLPDGDYNITFHVNDTAGNENASPLINFRIDTIPPANITNLAVAGNTSSSITLSWEASPDGDYVELWRNNVYVTDVSGVTHADTGLTSNTSYNYSLRPVDAAGNVGNWSNITAATQIYVSRGGGSSGGVGNATIIPIPEEAEEPEENVTSGSDGIGDATIVTPDEVTPEEEVVEEIDESGDDSGATPVIGIVLLLFALLIVFFILWKRRKEKEEEGRRRKD